MTLAQLIAWRDVEAKKSTAPKFMGKPDIWYDDAHWFCINGHVSGRYLGTEEGPKCLACRATVIMGPPIGEAEFKKVLESL